ncbi:MAG: hypothetical protein UY84_C0001G0150 [Candidatus Adlerbacteria bacterium GW2011_GWA2_54_12]|nr:MAG: hypothetical protein UY84_C0001G0150 [Candidatus Adlerbacteria bacterium GW2011_GWA2_54_12]
MRFSFWWILGLVGAIAALHFWGIHSGVYERQLENGFVWFDNALHILVGIVFGLTWVWFTGFKLYSTSLGEASLDILSDLAGAALLLSVVFREFRNRMA